ncbi:putative Phage shock protein C [Vibrio nigripulchritudo MADA3029]|uniref:Phage shock protein C n=2 Tax=Vibrio nigripulchritudo TaxID=28173 RepID=A0AAV2VJG9_9VIBR|nr:MULTISPECIES: envelope stress response membrane protein PspC [Vibrio]EGU52874.1 phage shock protein C [Vibrio nigripulchritudo ATCC 27043]KJY79808.1 phage-shock protein [Vibrio nigripulchritudo]UAB71792.1 envelope stress response membrane protein PspC [Vibrio sp. SCSIO 43132]CCN33981.1 putative Phage shock protein C [Vibrio nigripulchritudo AM115]CCN41090.1 putative Phage shock protein C [Vibrio nigripulchritudo FTn2]
MSRQSLYKDPENGKLAGVCAGVAQYFGAETWLVRILVVSAALLGFGFFVVLAYIAMALMLDKKPVLIEQKKTSQFEHKVKSKPWQSGGTPSQVIHNIDRELSELESSLQKMEAYVTSDAFKVNREFKNL